MIRDKIKELEEGVKLLEIQMALIPKVLMATAKGLELNIKKEIEIDEKLDCLEKHIGAIKASLEIICNVFEDIEAGKKTEL